MIERSESAMMYGNSGLGFRYQDDQVDLRMIYRQPDRLITVKFRAENHSLGRKEGTRITGGLRHKGPLVPAIDRGASLDGSAEISSVA